MTQTTLTPTDAKSTGYELAAPKVLLMGPAGTGKTHSIGTLVDAGVEVFYLALENGLESLIGYFTDKGKPVPANLHWHKVKAAKASFKERIAAATSINTMNLETLAKVADPNKGKHNQYISLLEALNDFTDERTGEKFGAVLDWPSNRALVIDGLTGMGLCAMALVIGGKSVRSQSDWGIAQDQLEKDIRKLCDETECMFVLIAHTERETDQVLGGVKLMASTLGAKLAPKLPQMFSDVILATRSGANWTWDTNSAIADVKTRNLPMQANNPPDFRPLLKKWESRSKGIN